MAYISNTTAHSYNGQTFYVNARTDAKGSVSYSAEADGYEFGFAHASAEDAIKTAEYKIWNRTQNDSLDSI